MNWRAVMGNPGNAVFWLKCICLIGFAYDVFLVARDAKRQFAAPKCAPDLARQRRYFWWNSFVGFVGNFLATLGIGAFATSTALFKLRGSVDDINIPGTLNVGDSFPTIMQAFLFLNFVEVDSLTLILMIVSSVAGARLGARIVTGWDRTKVRFGMGTGLAILGTVMLLKQLGIGPFGATGTALALRGTKLAIAAAVNVFLGALMNIGVGNFGPCLVLYSSLGMNVAAAYPMMMGSSALLLSFGNAPAFIRKSRYELYAVLAQAFWGCLSVYAGYRLVTSLSVTALLYIVICVVFLTSFLFFRDAIKDKRKKVS